MAAMIPDVEVKRDRLQSTGTARPGDCLTAETAEIAETSLKKMLCGLGGLCG